MLGGEHSFAVWAGSDESGKGDSFGPLVVAAVVLNQQGALNLVLRGVRDSKAVSDRKALELEAVIKEEALAWEVLELKPAFYNLRYEALKAQGGSLNTLLASGHFNALSKVLQGETGCQGVLIDQFMTSSSLVDGLQRRFPQLVVQQAVRAEADAAVAAASLLARARFLRTMEDLSRRAGQPLPKGSGPGTGKAALELCQRWGKGRLGDFAKLHFSNIQRVLRSL